MVFWCGILVGSVRGECKVQDDTGKAVSLGSMSKLSALQYDYDNDRLQCYGEDSCRNYTISNCYVLECLGPQSCQGAKLINNRGVSCKGLWACQDAQMLKSHNVVCTTPDKLKDPTCVQQPCGCAFIETDEAVLCFGYNACVARYGERMTVRVGAKGVVRCNDGQGAYSCQHLMVEVNHADRACFVRNLFDASRGSRCAVVCEGDHECNKDTIWFRVQPDS
ncbi:hypothetical protein ACA910_011503 [Epithemia clementina (nom. ined.)]